MLNDWENTPTLWSGVMSNREWVQAQIPSVVEAMVRNASNDQRVDQWDWIQRVFHYAKKGELLGAAGDGTIVLGGAKKEPGKK